jgi:hypothetical protein
MDLFRAFIDGLSAEDVGKKKHRGEFRPRIKTRGAGR